MNFKNLLYIIGLFVFFSCEKEDTAVVLPPPGDLIKATANIGTDYGKQVYVSLTNGRQVTRTLKDWDLAFGANDNDFHVYINTGKFMFVCRTGSSNFSAVDTTGKQWYTDNDHLDHDSTAIGNWLTGNVSTNEIMVVDRGKNDYSGIYASQRFKKLQLVSVSAEEYVILFDSYSGSNPQTFTIPKNNNYSLMYFSFDNGGKMVDVAPPKNEWDIVFTKYTHTYYDEPVGSPYRFYLVNGGLINRWNNTEGMKMIKDSTPDFFSFDAMSSGQLPVNTTTNADIIGYDWKQYDFNLNTYLIVPDRYYLIKNYQGYFYKLRFLDFYDDAGNRGLITFDYQRL